MYRYICITNCLYMCVCFPDFASFWNQRFFHRWGVSSQSCCCHPGASRLNWNGQKIVVYNGMMVESWWIIVDLWWFIVDLWWFIVDLWWIVVDLWWFVVDLWWFVVDLWWFVVDLWWFVVDLWWYVVELWWFVVDLWWFIVDLWWTIDRVVVFSIHFFWAPYNNDGEVFRFVPSTLVGFGWFMIAKLNYS